MARIRNAVRAVIRFPAAAARAVIRFPGAVRASAANRPRLVLTSWTAVVVVLALVVGFVFMQVHARDTREDNRRAALDAAEKKLVQVLSYNFRTVDEDVARAEKHLTGKFASDFKQFSSKLIVPNAKGEKITTDVEVVATSSVKVQDDQVVALMFVNQTTKRKGAKEPRIDGSRLRLTMEQVDDRWLISELTPV